MTANPESAEPSPEQDPLVVILTPHESYLLAQTGKIEVVRADEDLDLVEEAIDGGWLFEAVWVVSPEPGDTPDMLRFEPVPDLADLLVGILKYERPPTARARGVILVTYDTVSREEVERAESEREEGEGEEARHHGEDE